ncbi:longitudinals lacking isoform X1 [Haematobia irritans]|uniref:longitudinals lacking isoform X1 n=1 Tax=Haematobia irritans TaxID=7368 RepID=UPI003F501138
MDDDQQFCLRWNNHQSTLISVFDTLLENETLVDCTLAAEGKYLKAHKVVLSACSPYFATLLQEQYDKHPIFILKDVKYQELRAMMDYMYRGEVNISQDQLAALLKAAESLQIKGLSDNRSGGSASQPKPDHHRASMPGKLSGGYTLEQTKRARITGAGGPAIDASEMGSREGSSSPSRRRRKVRRRSIENALTDVHDNSNSSQQPTQSNASGLGAITAAASALAAAAAVAPTTAAALASTVVPLSATQQQPPQQTSSSAVSTAVPGTTLSSSKKTDNVKGSTQHQQQQDAMNTENVQGPAASATPAMDTDATDASTADKSNHKQQKSSATGASKDTSSVTGSDLVIEPKAEYDDEANDENVEDLTLDEEDMGMDDLDHNAGTSQGGEGSSQGYAPWQHDRSQDELLLATQEAQQRDPQDTPLEEVTPTNTTSAQNESRIRVRNWLMLADQSILEKSYNENTNTSETLINNNNNNNNNITSSQQNATVVGGTSTTATTMLLSTPTSLATVTTTTPTLSALSTTAGATAKTKHVLDPNTAATLTRIGSIGRTTITCITPAGGDATMGVTNPQAALAAAGVELDTVEDNSSMTEVVVKIENSNASSIDEEEEMPEEGEEAPSTEEDEDQDMNYDDIKLSSPMMWAMDSVKIEQDEEFEDILTAGFENSADMDDDMYQQTTTIDSTQSVSLNNANVSSGDMESNRNRILVAKKRVSLQTLKALSKHNAKMPYVTQIELQDPQELLEKHQHFKNLHLQPNQPVQIKLRSIPATITSIQTKLPMAGAPPLAPLSTMKSSSSSLTEIKPATSTSMTSDFKTTISDDRRYRMITQNQRTRKESLEHSDDMIYNADIEKPWVCRNCNRNYKWKNSLKCHLKNECGQPPRYFCSKLCGYATNVHSNLKRHMNTKCRERTEEENQTLLQQVQVQQPQLSNSGKNSSSATNSSASGATTSTAANGNSNNNNNNNNNTLETSTNTSIVNNVTSSSTTSTYTLVFQKSE